MIGSGQNTTEHLPFDIDITHLFTSDGCFIQDNITCVPNYDAKFIAIGITGRNIEWRSWTSEMYGEHVHK